MQKRSLKVNSVRLGSGVGASDVPSIKLSGKWLQESGFEYGQQVSVSVSKGRLVINLQKS